MPLAYDITALDVKTRLIMVQPYANSAAYQINYRGITMPI
jgi:hypothetical protein